MEGYDFYAGGALRGKAPWLLVVSSFWLRLGVIAAGFALFGLTKLYSAEASLLGTLGWILGCAWVAAHSFRRAKTLLDRLDEADIGPEARTSATGAAKATTHAAGRSDDVTATVAQQVRG